MYLGQNQPRDYGKHEFTIPTERSSRTARPWNVGHYRII